jgi:hypothetical protein
MPRARQEKEEVQVKSLQIVRKIRRKTEREEAQVKNK